MFHTKKGWLRLINTFLVSALLLTGCGETAKDSKHEETTSKEAASSAQTASSAAPGVSKPLDNQSELLVREAYVLGDTISLSVSDKLKEVDIQTDDFQVYVNGVQMSLVSAEKAYDYSIKLQLPSRVYSGQLVYLTYAGGKVNSDKGLTLPDFIDKPITNINNMTGLNFLHEYSLNKLSGVDMQSLGGMFVASDGTLFVTDPVSGFVAHIASDGSLIAKWGKIAASEQGFGEAGPHGISRSRNGILLVSDPSKNRLIAMTEAGKFLKTVGVPAQKDELPVYKSASNQTNVSDYGRLYLPNRMSSRGISGNGFSILDARGVLQEVSTEKGEILFAEKGTYILDKTVLADPTKGFAEMTGSGHFVTDTARNMFHEILYRAFLPYQWYDSPAVGTLPASFVQPSVIVTDEADSFRYVLDSGNCRVQILDNINLMVRDMFGSYGDGGEQFINPQFIQLVDDVLFIGDTGSVSIKAYRINVMSSLSLTTTSPHKVTETTANPRCSFQNSKNEKILEKGVAYADHPYPTLADKRMKLADSFADDRFELTGLTPGTHYYARGYAVLETGVYYSYQTEFTTLGAENDVDVLIVEQPRAFDGSGNALIGCAVVGLDAPEEVGFDISSTVSFEQSEQVPATMENGQFSGKIVNKGQQDCVFVRGFARIGEKIVYSRTAVIQKNADPIVAISRSYLQSGEWRIKGWVQQDNGHAITEVGVVFAEKENPTITDGKLVGTLSKDKFEVVLKSSGKRIYYRSYAATSEGVFYGNGGFVQD